MLFLRHRRAVRRSATTCSSRTIYITEVKAALLQGEITREQFDLLAVAINTGTNIPSVATPNGQAAFLFLLTSALAPLIRLAYGRMVWMALAVLRYHDRGADGPAGCCRACGLADSG